jgi:hypothetical protein
MTTTKPKRTPKTRSASNRGKSIAPLTEELSKITNKIDTFNNRLEVLQSKIEITNERVTQVNDKVENSVDELKELNSSTKKDKPALQPKSPWWITITGILGVPALLIYMFLQFSQASQSSSQIQLNQTEEIKTRAEIQQIINNLETTKTQNPDAYIQQINDVLPKLQTALDKLNDANKVNIGLDAVENLYRSMLIIIFAEAVGYILHVFEIVWFWLTSTFSPIVLRFFYDHPHIISRKKRNSFNKKGIEDRTKYRERITNIFTVSVSTMNSIPMIVRLVATIFIFTTLTIPLFNQVSLSLGFGISFSSILDHLWKLDLPGAVEILRNALFH